MWILVTFLVILLCALFIYFKYCYLGFIYYTCSPSGLLLYWSLLPSLSCCILAEECLYMFKPIKTAFVSSIREIMDSLISSVPQTHMCQISTVTAAPCTSPSNQKPSWLAMDSVLPIRWQVSLSLRFWRVLTFLESFWCDYIVMCVYVCMWSICRLQQGLWTGIRLP